MIEISIVIPNFNGVDHLGPCIEAAHQSATNSKQKFEIIVADDASTDSSVEFIKKNFPFVKIIESKTNSGFATNINRGIHAAGGRFCLALNNDVRVAPDLVEVLLVNFKMTENLFSVQPSIFNELGELTDSAKIAEVDLVLCLSGFRSTGNIFKTDQTRIPHLFSSGACVLYDGEKLKKLGGFDEVFAPYYNEDVDLCLRAWRLGWSSVYDPQTRCVHEGSATIGKLEKSGVRVISKSNRFLLHLRHLAMPDLIPWTFVKIIQSVFEVCFKPRFVFSVWKRVFLKMSALRRSQMGPRSLRSVFKELKLKQ